MVIAEDEALIRLDLKEMLEEEGYDVVGEAGDGETAIRLAAEQRPDLVVLDVKMPVLDGIAAAERIAGERIARVWTSDMSRAVQTGEIVAAGAGVDVTVRTGLREFGVGDAAGTTGDPDPFADRQGNPLVDWALDLATREGIR